MCVRSERVTCIPIEKIAKMFEGKNNLMN